MSFVPIKIIIKGTFHNTQLRKIVVLTINNIYVRTDEHLWGYQLIKTVQSGGAQPIFEILHMDNQMVCNIEVYLIPI